MTNAMKPSALKRKPSPLAERPPLPIHAHLLTAENSYVRFYTLGDCTVLVTRELGRFHLSISHRKRYPTWEEISEAWYRVVPGAAGLVGALILPPLNEYINIDPNCFQVHEIDALDSGSASLPEAPVSDERCPPAHGSEAPLA